MKPLSLLAKTTLVSTVLLVAIILLPFSASAANGTWTNVVSGGNWSAAANWSGATIADASGFTADFNTINITTDPTVVHLDSARTIGNLTFGDTTTSSAASWILDNNATAANTLTLAGGTPTITVNALGTGKTATVGPVIAGSTAWTKAGAGILVLTNVNAFSGGFTVSAGALAANIAGALGTNGAATVNGTLDLNAGGVNYLGLTNSVSGSGTINVVLGTGSGATTMNGNNSGFSGTINLGTNGVTGAVAAAGAGKMQINSALASTATVNVLANATLYISAPVTNQGALTLYGGDTGESLGQLRIEGSANWAGPVTLAGAITGAGDGTIGCNSGTGTVSGNISDAGGARQFIKFGASTLALTGTNSWTGPTIVNQATLNLIGNQNGVTGGFYVGTNANAVNLTIGNSSQSVPTTLNVAAGNIVKTASAGTSFSTINISASSAFPTLATNNGTLSIGRDSQMNVNTNASWFQKGDMTIQANGGFPGTLVVQPGGNFIYSGTPLITNSAPNSSGNANITISGTFTTSQGFYFNDSGSTGIPIMTLQNGGTLALSANIPQLTTLGGAGPIGKFLLGTNGTINTAGFSTTNVMILANASGVTGSLVKTGAGTLELDAANTYTGPTTISGGTLALGASASLASTNFNLSNGGNFDVSLLGGYTIGSSATLSGSGSITGNFSDSSGSQIYPGANGSIGTLSFNNDLTLAGGDTLYFDFSNGGSNDVINVSGTITPNGTTTINLVTWPTAFGFAPGNYVLLQATNLLAGSVGNFVLTHTPGRQNMALVYDTSGTPQKLVLQVSSTGNPASLFWQGGLSGNAWDVQTTSNWLNGATLDYFYSADNAIFSNVPPANASVNITAPVAPTTVVFDGTNNYILSGSGYISGTASLTKNANTTVTLATANDYNGGTLINAGTLQLGDGVAIPGSVLGIITNNATLAVANPVDQTLANNLTGSGQLVKSGSAILTLSGANSLAGGTLISTGVLKAASSVALGSATTTIASGAVLAFDSSANFTQSGSITGAGAVVKTNTDAVTLSASNSFSGGLTINLGAVFAGNNYAFGTGPVVIDNNSLGGTVYSQLFLKNGVNISNAITVVAGASFFQGLIETDAGTYSYGTANGSGTGSDTNGATLSGPITLAPGTIQRGGLFVGPISGANWLNINGPVTNTGSSVGIRNGRVRMAGGGDYATLSLAAGVGSIGANNGICTNATLSIGGSGASTFDLNGFSQTLAGLNAGANASLLTNSSATPGTLALNLTSAATFVYPVGGKIHLVVNGTGSLNLATNNYSGNTTVNGGTLQLALATLATNSSVTIATNSVLQLDFTTTNTVSAISLNGVSQPPGVYNSTTAAPYITGTGSLLIASTVATYATNLTATVSGNQIVLSWPATHLGWTLQAQTNALATGLGNNWADVSGSASVNSVTNTIDSANGAVFYRLKY